MKKIFDSKYYPTVMFLLISITTIMIIFNFINIANSVSKISNNTDKKITGFVVSEEKLIKDSKKQTTTYSKKTGYMFNALRVILMILISLLSIRLIIKRVSY